MCRMCCIWCIYCICFICCIYSVCSICCMCCIYWNSLICRICCICCMRCICCMYCICCIYCIDCISIGLLNIYPGGGGGCGHWICMAFASPSGIYMVEYVCVRVCVCCVVRCGCGGKCNEPSIHQGCRPPPEPKCPTPPDGQRLKCVVSAARRCVCAACRGSSGGPGLGT